MKELCSELSPQYKTLERWIKEEKEKGFNEFFISVKYSVVPVELKYLVSETTYGMLTYFTLITSYQK